MKTEKEKWEEAAARVREKARLRKLEKEMEMRTNELVEELIRHVNGPSRILAKELREQVRDLHPALQQEFVRCVIIPVCEELVALPAAGVDVRNKWAVGWAGRAINDEVV